MAPKKRQLVAAGDSSAAPPSKRGGRLPPRAGATVAEPAATASDRARRPLPTRAMDGNMDNIPIFPSQFVHYPVVRKPTNRNILSKLESIEEQIKSLIQKVDKQTCSCPNHHDDKRIMQRISMQEANQKGTSVEAEGLATNEGKGNNTSIQLRFLNGIKTPIYHDDDIKSENNAAIKIGIFNGEEMIKSGQLSNVKVEILALEGDFPYDTPNSWTAKDFDDHRASGRDGKANVLAGEGTTAHLINGERDLGSIRFREGSFRARKGMFIVGARVCEDERTGVRVQEAVMKPVAVHDRRNKSNEKSYPPKLDDKVYRLEEIAKDGIYCKRLENKRISTVQDFLKALNKDPDNLAKILQIKKEYKTWEKMVTHAQNCCLQGKYELKSYRCAERDVVLFFNCVHRLVGAEFKGRYTAFDMFDPAQLVSIDELKRQAYDQLDAIPYDYVMTETGNSSVPHYMGSSAGPSYISNAMQQNCSGHLAAHQVQDLSQAQMKSSCVIANNDPGPSSFIPDSHRTHNYEDQGIGLADQEQSSSAILNGLCQSSFGILNSSIGTMEVRVSESDLCRGIQFGKKIWDTLNTTWNPTQIRESPILMTYASSYVPTINMTSLNMDRMSTYRLLHISVTSLNGSTLSKMNQKRWVEMSMQWRREAYARREYEQQQEEPRLKWQEEERMSKTAQDHTAAQAREAERARKRERACRAKATGPDALRKDKYPRCTQ